MAENMRATWQGDIAAALAALVVMGQVTTASPLAVLVDGESTSRAMTRLTSYTAALNDRVLCLRVGGKYTVLGKVV